MQSPLDDLERGEKKTGASTVSHGLPGLCQILDRQLAGKLVTGGYLLYVSTYSFAA